ncbi:hypothetical protein [Aureispira sp. CCB-E]|uniref:hypothetical protein n=1 Tax=Aureispira sp. CCB-E TaxID=3051121 RepID=UPI002869561E|nr:hypothetical protein [Aureispira sp. CCB-E]WMX16887.1 hypothetical protein QP953_10940 [Aureispira sp. CCB-E]
MMSPHRKFLFVTLVIFLIYPYVDLQAQRVKKVKFSRHAGAKEINSPLPSDYTDRTFIRGLAGYRNQIDQLVGHVLLIKKEKGKNKKPVILGRYVRKNSPPKMEAIISDKALYSSKIDGSCEFNGHYMIASVNASVESVYELTITDIAMAIIPDSLIPYTEICEAFQNADQADSEVNLYYVKSAKLTTVYTKDYVRIQSATEVSGGDIFGLKGEIYNSSDNYAVNYVVSADIVSLNDMLLLQNCDKKIEEKKIRLAAAEAAKEAAIAAKELQKAKELELKTTKSELAELSKELSKLKKQLEAQSKESKEYQTLALKQALAIDRMKETIQNQAQIEQDIEVAKKERNAAEKVVVLNNEIKKQTNLGVLDLGPMQEGKTKVISSSEELEKKIVKEENAEKE